MAKTAKKAKPKTMKMPPLTFVPCGDYHPGNGVSRDTEIPLAVRKARHKLWQEWRRYNRLKLAAALAGDISRKRDAKVESIYARRGSKTVKGVRDATQRLWVINESLHKYHSVILDHAKVDRAIELLTACKPSKPTPKPVRQKLAHARAMAAKGYTIGHTHDGVTVMLTPENYKAPLSRLVEARLAHDAAHEAKFKDVWKCKCASHYPDGDITKPRKED